MLSDEVLQSIIACGFDPLKGMIVACSGGADSLALVHILYRAGCRPLVAHLDHALRPSSATQAEALGNIIRAWNLPFISERIDVAAYARSHKLSIEEGARACRYRFLFDLAARSNARALLTAHHADDQVETVLMHFLRGSGVEGLAGIRPKSFLPDFNAQIPLLRPMLGISREDILQYLHEHGLKPIEDESNRSPRYFRNRLRLETIPQLTELNPAFKQVCQRNAKAIASDVELLQELEEQAWQDCLKTRGEDSISFDYMRFFNQPEGLQRRLLRRAFFSLRPQQRDLGFDACERMRLGILQAQPKNEYGAGLCVFCLGDALHIAPQNFLPPLNDFPQMPSESPLLLYCSRRVSLANGWTIRAELVDGKTWRSLAAQQSQPALHAWLKPDDLEWPLIIRPPRVGERWSPLGMGRHSQKLSDTMINSKIPQQARKLWPLVCCGNSILWFVGERITQAWRCTGDELDVLHLQLQQP